MRLCGLLLFTFFSYFRMFGSQGFVVLCFLVHCMRMELVLAALWTGQGRGSGIHTRLVSFFYK